MQLHFTKHAIERLEQRLNTTPDEVMADVDERTVRMTINGARKLRIYSKNASLVLNGNGTVVTAYALK